MNQTDKNTSKCLQAIAEYIDGNKGTTVKVAQLNLKFGMKYGKSALFIKKTLKDFDTLDIISLDEEEVHIHE